MSAHAFLVYINFILVLQALCHAWDITLYSSQKFLSVFSFKFVSVHKIFYTFKCMTSVALCKCLRCMFSYKVHQNEHWHDIVHPKVCLVCCVLCISQCMPLNESKFYSLVCLLATLF